MFHNGHYACVRCRRPVEKSPLAQIQVSPPRFRLGSIGPMTVITMSRTEGGQDRGNGGIDADGSLLSRRRGRPSNRSYPSA
jgi:hypothetical protein